MLNSTYIPEELKWDLAQWRDELITVVGVQQPGPAVRPEHQSAVRSLSKTLRSSLPVQRELQSDGCSGHDLFTSNHSSMQLNRDTESEVVFASEPRRTNTSDTLYGRCRGRAGARWCLPAAARPGRWHIHLCPSSGRPLEDKRTARA